MLKVKLAAIGRRRAKYEGEREELAELQRSVAELIQVRVLCVCGGGEGYIGVKYEGVDSGECA